MGLWVREVLVSALPHNLYSPLLWPTENFLSAKGTLQIEANQKIQEAERNRKTRSRKSQLSSNILS
jgi:hypothetical protein